MSLSGRKTKLLFLYSELADYFLACIRELGREYPVEISVIHWPVNKEAPFQFTFPDGVSFYDRKQFNLTSLRQKVKDISPDFIYCSGWMDKDYLSVAKEYKKKIPVVIGLDTKWEGSFRQYVACVLSRITIRKTFTHCWVPGQKQKQYALKLGFKEAEILTGYYTADVEYFKTLGEKVWAEKSKKYPHRFIYAGRYYEFKGIKDLWNAFIKGQLENPNDWELWCLGTGDIEPVQHPKIKHFGFVQPKDMEQYLARTGVFVMPSRFEPWGVVLHEFAAAGFPLICSDEVGAAEALLRNGENGYIYRAGDVNGLMGKMKDMAMLSDEKLMKMGEISKELAGQNSPRIWADKLMKLIRVNN